MTQLEKYIFLLAILAISIINMVLSSHNYKMLLEMKALVVP